MRSAGCRGDNRSRGSATIVVACRPAGDVGADARAERLAHQRPEDVDPGRISRRLDDQQRLAAVILGRNQQEARRAAERIQFVGHAVGLEGRVLAGEPAFVRGDRHLFPWSSATRSCRSRSRGRFRTGRPPAREAMKPQPATIGKFRSSAADRRLSARIVRVSGRFGLPGCDAERAFEQRAAVAAAMRGFDQVFRMRHQAEHVAAAR